MACRFTSPHPGPGGMYLVSVAKEKSLLSSVNLQDDYDRMAGVNNSHTIFSPQGLAYEGQDQSHPQKPSQVPRGYSEGESGRYMYAHHTQRHLAAQRHICVCLPPRPNHRHMWGRQLKPLHHERLVILVAKKNQRPETMPGHTHHPFLIEAFPRGPLHTMEPTSHIVPNSNTSGLDL